MKEYELNVNRICYFEQFLSEIHSRKINTSRSKFLDTTSEWYLLLQTGICCLRLVFTALDWYLLPQTIIYWFRPVFTGSDRHILPQSGIYWFRPLFTGSDWYFLLRTGIYCFYLYSLPQTGCRCKRI